MLYKFRLCLICFIYLFIFPSVSNSFDVNWLIDGGRFGGEHTLNQEAFELYQKGLYSEAIVNAQRVLEIRRKKYGEKHLSVAITYNFLGILNRELGNYHKALQNCERSLEIRTALLGTQHRDTAVSLASIGTIHSDLGNY